MKNIPILVLSVLLAVCLISGLILYRQNRAEILSKDERIMILQERLKTSSAEVVFLNKEIAKGREGIERLQSQLTDLRGEEEESVLEIKKLRTKYEAKIAEFDKELQNRGERITDLQGQLKESCAEVVTLNEETAKDKEDIERLQSQLTALRGEKEAAVAEADMLRTTHEAKIAEFDKELQNRDERITDLQGRLKALIDEINSLNETVDKSQREIEGLNLKLSGILGQELHLASELEQMKSTYDAMVSDLKKQIQNKEVTINRLENKLSITFVDQILFEFGKAKVTPQGKEILKKVGDILKNIEGKRIQVIGHTDNKAILPDYQYRFPSNWELSAIRAAAVVRFLQKDIMLDGSNFEVVGRSFYEPISSNETEKGRATNRRVTIIIAPKIE